MRETNRYYNHWLPKLLKVKAITFNKSIYYASDIQHISGWIKRHEMKHIEQYQHYGVLLFLIIYLKDYLKGRLRGYKHYTAYLSIPFEIEARKAENERR